MSEGTNAPSELPIDTRMRLALERLGRQLTPEEIANVRSRFERQRAALTRLRRVPLANGNEPAPLFDPAPHRAEAPPP